MSEENVELVKAWVEALNRADLPALLELADPEIEYSAYLARVSGGQGTYRGHDEFRRYFGELTEAWEWFRIEIDEYRDLGDNVVNAGRLTAKGATSGVEVEERLAWLHTFRPGKGPGRYLRHRAFATVDEALDATREPG